MLTVHEDRTAAITCQRDSGQADLVRQDLEFTDFPLPEMKLYVVGNPGEQVLMLPSEY